jgi:SAM-dependent methyltransferase
MGGKHHRDLEAQDKMKTRQRLSVLILSHTWLPAAAMLSAASVFAALSVLRPRLSWFLGAGAAIGFSSFVCGYYANARKYIKHPLLGHLYRRQYAEVWDGLAASPRRARAAACGKPEEDALRRSAERPVRNILELTGLGLRDEALEIGCGVGRIGLELAPRCRFWTGVDISANMLAVASQRLSGLKNVRLMKLVLVGLEQFEAETFDIAYSTNMFDHLDEMDRWLYVKDAFRVLRPGGRLFIDNTDLESDAGWAPFARDASSTAELERPPYMPKPATSAEYATYARRAGFVQIQVHQRSPLLILTAIKPDQDAG